MKNVFVYFQVLKNPDTEKETRENKEKEKIVLKENKTRPKKEDKFKDKVREREIKLQQKLEKNRDKDSKPVKKQEEKKIQSRKEESKIEDKNENKEERHVDSKDDFREKKSCEEKKGKSYEKMRLEKKRLADAKKQGNDGTGNTSKAKGDEDGKMPVKETVKEKKESRVDDVTNSDKLSSPSRERELEKRVDKLNLNGLWRVLNKRSVLLVGFMFCYCFYQFQIAGCRNFVTMIVPWITTSRDRTRTSIIKMIATNPNQ